MSLGPLMVDIAGTALDAEDRELLCEPAVGGVILFARNFVDPQQVAALIGAIHALREPRLLVAVDQEGGRVQRFRNGFTPLPPARLFGRLYRDGQAQALRHAEESGWLMAAELRAIGVDFSFAPVLDLDFGISGVIGDRAFAAEPDAVARLAQAWARGARAAGMGSVGKHFPGHGGVAADSHVDLPVDERPLADLWLADLIPFERLINAGLEGIMPAHVRYPRVDARAAGFSRVWLSEILRGRLGFEGVIFSDDLDMAGAAEAGDDSGARARAALAAGCDMVLVCNNRAAAAVVAGRLQDHNEPASQLRMVRLQGGAGAPGLAALRASRRWRDAERFLAGVAGGESLALDLK